MISLDTASDTPRVMQIVQRIHGLAEDGTWPPGTRVPSIRALARQCGVSPLTVSNAYNRLVADGILEARRASGFFVGKALETIPFPAPSSLSPSTDSSWMLQQPYDSRPDIIQAGCGWLPDSALFVEGIRHAFTALGRRPDPRAFSYGNPYGHDALREDVRLLLLRQGIQCDSSGIVLTHGTSQALELSIRALTLPGDTVLVEDPGYGNLFPVLRALGLKMIGIPRLKDGPCLETLERVCRTSAPRAFVLNTRLQNPTGTSCSPPITHHVLSLAERHDFTIVEDDVFGGLAPDTLPLVAHLDQLRRVIYLGSFSKTISPGLRVGFMTCPPHIVAPILRLKMAASLSSSAMNEAIVHAVLADGRYRHHLEKLRDRLGVTRKRAIALLENAGLSLFCRPEHGMFLWARFPGPSDPTLIAAEAAQRNIMLAPGNLFSPIRAQSPWLRFNVSQMDDPRLTCFLHEAATAQDA